MSIVSLRVNGAAHEVDVEPATPLLYVLRNDLGLHGPRFGCGLAQCGACTVIIDGVAMRSCITPTSAARGEITTLEGISKDGKLHPLQQAWIDEQVPQCGYCQSGMMIAAVDLLQKNPSPTVAQIKDAYTNTPPSPHLCRCGTYNAIISAVQRAAKAMNG
jgi:aerobic-type carbon monoxide dehydrogenase small subunit (CoxS/CutS family)